MSGDFDGEAVQMALGSIRGVRAFGVDGLGRLCGITVEDPFGPGENVASCRVLTGGLSYTPDMPVRTDEHRAGASGCTCGYWAHTTENRDYMRSDRWTAVVDGYGLVTRGTKGFRAEKARLVALVPPLVQTIDTARTLRLYSGAGVPVFVSLVEALAAHPIDGDELPDPSGDFWTKAVPVDSMPAWCRSAPAVAAYLYSAPRTTGTGCTCVLCR